MQDDLMKRLRDSLMGLNSVQDVQVPFRPEEEEIPEVQPQELQQEVISQQEQEAPPQVNQGINTQPPIPPVDNTKTLESLRAKMLSSDDGYDAKLQEARDSDFKRTALAQALNVLGTAAMGQHQKAAGQSLGLKPIEMDAINTQQSALEKSRKQGLEKLMQEYKLLQDEQTFKDSSEDRTYDRKLKEAQIKELENKSKGITSRGSLSPITGEPLSPGQKKVDEDYAKRYNDFISKDKNNTINTLNKMDALASELEKDKGLIQSGGGRTSVLPDVLRFSDSIRRRDEARNYANASLKELFGGQLSDAEREAAANEYYNDKLSNEENAKLLRTQMKKLEDNLRTKTEQANYFKKYQTLEGHEPTSMTERTKVVNGKKYRKVQGGWMEIK
jgi:hypothetical protein